MWPFSSTPTASTSTDAGPNACPVDHSTREAWLKANPSAPRPGQPAPSSSRPPSSAQQLSAEREVSSIPRWTAPASTPVPGDLNSAEAAAATPGSENWVYPSPQSFFNALERKNRDPQAQDMPVVVPIHNAVNEKVWQDVLRWERDAGAAEGGSKLVSFIGRPKDLSPRARWKSIIG